MASTRDDDTPHGVPGHIRQNRATWNATSDAYQERHDEQLRHPKAWGVWELDESELDILGDVSGKRVLELGCGASQWGAFLARDGARMVGMDLSERQLAHARRFTTELGVTVPLVHANAERLPFRDASFDVVFCDHGATSFSDPFRTIPEAARVLAPGGRLAFNMSSPLRDVCYDAGKDAITDRLARSYFDLNRTVFDDTVDFQLPYGEWIRLFRRSGLVVEDLVEPRPPDDARTSYEDYAPLAWSRQWPSENVWVLRRESGPL